MDLVASILEKSIKTEAEKAHVISILSSFDFFKHAEFTKEELHKISLKLVIEKHKPMKTLYKK